MAVRKSRSQRRFRPSLEILEDRLLLSSTLGMPDSSALLGDLAQFHNDLATSSATLINAVQPSQVKTPTLASVESQLGKVWTILVADENKISQAMVSYEVAALAAEQQAFVTLLDNFFGVPSAPQGMPPVATSPNAGTSVGGTASSGGGATPGGNTSGVFSPAEDGPNGPNIDPTRTASGGLGADINGVYGSGSFNGTINSSSFNFTTSGQLTSPPYTAYSGTLSGTVSGTKLSGTFSINAFTGTVTGSFTPLNTNSITISGSYSGSDGNGNTISGGFNGSISGPLPFPAADMAQHLCNCGGPNETGSLLRTPATLSGPTIPQTIPKPVRYGDGVADIVATDLHSDGFGFPWGQTRVWSNAAGYPWKNDNGNGWVDTYTPYLLSGGPSSVIFIANGNTAYYYDNGMHGLQPRFNDGSHLTYNSSNDTYTLIDTQGDQIVFAGFSTSRPTAQQGQLISYTDPYGHTIAVTSYTSNGQIAEMQRSTTSNGNTTIESWLFSYQPTGDAGTLASLTQRTQVNGGAWTTVRQVQYSYYGVGAQHGNPGDLMTATVLDGSGNVLDTSYYRYYTPGQANGYAEGLEFVFNPDSYLRLTAAFPGQNLDKLSDAEVAPYADNYFQYDSQQRVTQETVQGDGDSQTGGGLGTYTFSYTFSNAGGLNSWAVRTVVSNPDSSTDTVYTNSAYEVMLDDHYDPSSGLHTDSFYAYNNQAQLVLAAAPSAVNGYSDSYADLLNNQNGNYQYLNNSSGQISRYVYYTTTTATETTEGGVTGYLYYELLQQGQQGTGIQQGLWQYYAHAYNGQIIAPLAKTLINSHDDGTGTEPTYYGYTWYSGTAGMQSETVDWVVTTASNGTGVPEVATTYFDPYGNAQWVQDPDGYLQYDAYDAATGALLTQIVDVNTADVGEFTNLPSGWHTPSGGGLNLVTTDQVDALGRTTEETSPAGNITYYVYLDPQHEERIYQGWNVNTGTPTDPTEVIHHDAYDGYDEVLTMTATPNLTNGAPDGSEAISGLQTLTRDYTNVAGQVTAEDAYFNLGGLAYATGLMGAINVNFYQAQYGYDNWGRLVRMQTANGTIYRTVYNSLDEEVSDWVGTNDTPTSGEWSPTNNTGTSNMVMVSSYQYDNGGVGDGNLTQETDYPGLGQPNRVTQNWFDWRDRLVAQKSGVESNENDGVNRPIIVTTYDNLDEVIETQQYAGDGVTPQIVNGVLQALDPSLLRAQAITSYDERGRVYQTQVYDVNPSTGVVSSSALTTNYYYDHRGDVMAESDPGGLWTKSQYDGAGRDVMDYTTDGAGGTTWTDASNVTNDTVLEQDQTVYDADSNDIETIDSQRFHNATGTGPLGSPTSGIGARVYYAAAYYDNADRLTADVDAGTNGGTAWTRPSTPPASSATVLVTTYAYNSMGLVQDVTDPMGIVNRTYYDNLGRTTKTIQDYTGGTPGAENDITTEYGYDGNDNVLYVQADEPGGSYQKTAYVYSVTTASGSGVNSNDILSAIQHPDPTTGQPSSSQQDSYLVNALGQTVQSTDRNGNVHQYTYDVLGRITADAVTTLGAEWMVRCGASSMPMIARATTTSSPATTQLLAATSSTKFSAPSTVWVS